MTTQAWLIIIAILQILTIILLLLWRPRTTP